MSYSMRKAILTKTFHEMDVSQTGYLDGFEIEDVFIKYYTSIGADIEYETIMNKVLDFMKRVDTNGDKKVSLNEFLSYFLSNVSRHSDDSESDDDQARGATHRREESRHSSDDSSDSPDDSHRSRNDSRHSKNDSRRGKGDRDRRKKRKPRSRDDNDGDGYIREAKEGSETESENDDSYVGASGRDFFD